MDKPYNKVDIHRALKKVLSINYNFRWIDLVISPLSTTWYTAVQFRNDPKRRWHPRIAIFYPLSQTVAIFEKLGASPLVVEASTIIVMADKRAQSPPDPDPEKYV